MSILKSGTSKTLSGQAAKQEEPDRMKLALSKPEKFDELLSRERDAGGRLPVDTVK